MKRIFVFCAVFGGLALCAGKSEASWGHLSYSGYQPWWNVFAKRYKCLTPEEERLQKFWHDYYDALKCFYCALDHIDWVAYYKNHGYQINAGCGGPGGCGRINYAPVFVSPTLQWAVPAGCAGGPPVGPPYAMGGPPGGGPPPYGPMAYGPPGGYGPPPSMYPGPGGPGGPGGYPGGMPMAGMQGGPSMGPMQAPMGGTPTSTPAMPGAN